MSVNTSKTKFLIFHSRGKKLTWKTKKLYLKTTIQHCHLIHTSFPNLSAFTRTLTIHPHDRDKLLGILFDKHLSFNYHIDLLKSKLSKALFCINGVKNFVPQKTLKTLYFSIFHSHLLYCPLIVNCATKTNIQKIAVMQKKAIRSITNSKSHSHTDPLFSSLKILPYHKIIYQSQLTFFHSIHNKYAPSSFNNVWQTNSERNPTYSLRNANEYFVPPANLTFFERFPLHTLPKTWNNAGNITLYKNLTTFKIALNFDLLNDNEAIIPPEPPNNPISCSPIQYFKIKMFISLNKQRTLGENSPIQTVLSVTALNSKLNIL